VPFPLLTDWTDRCIAVIHAEMQQIWALVADGTPIKIYPVWSLADNLAG
jgi:murein L,D-transpeptidase YafK